MDPKPQLHMIWPEALCPAEPATPPGYRLRPLADGDEPGHVAVMREAGFDHWTSQSLADYKHRVLPEGIFVVEHLASGRIVATASAGHRSTELHPFGGELGWVAASPAHAGRGLGLAVCLAVVRRFRAAGYRRIYLQTDDHRLAAIKVYLKMGFVPLLYADDMAERWRAVGEVLGWPIDPQHCPRPV